MQGGERNGSSLGFSGLISPEVTQVGGMVLGKLMPVEGSGACGYAWLNPCKW